MKIEKRGGPRTESWNTPCSGGQRDEENPTEKTEKEQPGRYEEDQLSLLLKAKMDVD